MREMRRKDRLVTDEKEIQAILDACGIVRLGLYDEGRIYIVPVNYSYTYEEGKLTLTSTARRRASKKNSSKKTEERALKWTQETTWYPTKQTLPSSPPPT